VFGLAACERRDTTPAVVEANQSESVEARVDSRLEKGWAELGKANHANARDLGEDALAEATKGGYELGEASACMLLGRVARDTAAYDEALDYHRRALAIRERVLGSEHTDTAAAYDDIGVVYEKTGEYDKALEYHQKALGIAERILGPEHPTTAFSHGNIGTALTYDNVAMDYDAKGEYDKALEFHRKALDTMERVLGPEHPDTELTRDNIAALCEKYEPACSSR
jgi:tetratricopeptide (TPR) repeat protein